MTARLAASALVLALFASTAPVAAAEDASSTDIGITAPTELPCAGTGGRNRARCITDALKSWKELLHDYDEAEDDIIARWKADHARMGIGSDYQKALRAFLSDMRAQRKEFQKQLQEFRKEFFDKQKEKREEGDGRKATEKKLDKATLEDARAQCGPVDDDGKYRTCMRHLLRGVPASAARRSRSSTKLLGE